MEEQITLAIEGLEDACARLNVALSHLEVDPEHSEHLINEAQDDISRAQDTLFSLRGEA